MNKTINSDGDFLHKEYPKQFSRDDFWRQIKRTVNGEPASEAEIDQIVNQIDRRLDLCSDDCLLDLGCGNGALGSQLFDTIAQYVGVDFSDYLLEIASEYFSASNRISWHSADIRDVSNYLPQSSSTTKVLMYGCVAYLEKADVSNLLGQLSRDLPNLTSVFIGNVPWRKKSSKFFATRNVQDFDLDDPSTPIGVWWEVEEFHEIAKTLGFNASSFQMPPEFYGSQYRFDLLMER